jgi:chaperone protein EcpD
VFAVRTRIKVFFRPKALRGDPNLMMNQASWKIIQKDGNWVAEGTNPTPYHMSFFNVSLGGTIFDGGMLPPMGKGTVLLGEVGKFTPDHKQIKVEFVSDFGGPIPVEFALNPGP